MSLVKLPQLHELVGARAVALAERRPERALAHAGGVREIAHQHAIAFAVAVMKEGYGLSDDPRSGDRAVPALGDGGVGQY